MKTVTWILPLAAALSLGGCAARAPVKQAEVPPGPTAAEDEEAMRVAVEQLENAKASAVVPRAHNDCQAVCRLADVICEAADRICVIANRHAGEQAYAGKCDGAEKDCKGAQENCNTCTEI